MSIYLKNQSLHNHEHARSNAQHEAASSCLQGYWSLEANELRENIWREFDSRTPDDGEGFGMGEWFSEYLYEATNGLFSFPRDGLAGQPKAALIMKLVELYGKAVKEWTLEKEFGLHSRNVDTNFYVCSPPDHERLYDLISFLVKNEIIYSW